ncbi:hypothetical protein EXIGLDRAFT_729605 [Exidia glandulosa HHB12029]|uniref:Uncharacterized protein n=1 Tax=Exidia glandulosa HHB12029 TaxID=1314781 RepID=A0A165ZGE0_EXIGL|nr:hypothetical protein EXIGLDRAFT_729605 [Exidia glandulosa HHB12029]
MANPDSCAHRDVQAFATRLVYLPTTNPSIAYLRRRVPSNISPSPPRRSGRRRLLPTFWRERLIALAVLALKQMEPSRSIRSASGRRVDKAPCSDGRSYCSWLSF